MTDTVSGTPSAGPVGLPDLAAGPAAFDEQRTPWRAWAPQEALRRLSSLAPGARWAVAGGWAIDLYLGRVTRAHEDLEITLLAADVDAVLGAFREPAWRWVVPDDGFLHAADPESLAATHQTWLWSPVERAFVLDVFREAHDGDTWICRRDPEIRRPWAELVATSADGVPHLEPDVVLLFKAKHRRAKDEADLRAVLPALGAARRERLRAALAWVHPGHPWLELLGSDRRDGQSPPAPVSTAL